MAAPVESTPNVPTWMLVLRKHRGMIVPVGFVLMLAVVVVPLPPAFMDLLICLNIALSVVILMTTMYMKEPLEFSVFPSLLLATTLFRLVLNIASTRLILSADANSPQEALDVAGHVIAAFGSFVAGESLYVGVIIFLILVIVQFVVITKGATRISEVAARFTLDAMPGKQLAIDADLNAGVINEAEARRRRERISQEADFFGAMDGASKFVRGDAIAGIIITVINIVGGIAIGVIDKGWPIGQTTEIFTKLTIGDGLTSQIPAFVVAISSALIVTRSGTKNEIGDEIASQITNKPTGLFITAGFLTMLAFTPLPTLPLAATAAILTAGGLFMARSARKAHIAAASGSSTPIKAEPPPPEAMLKMDAMELEVGYALVPLVDTHQGGDLLERISNIRRQLASDLGIVMPPIRIRDNLQLQPQDYRIKIKGASVARGMAFPGKLMAIDSGISSGRIDGIPGKEPAFGLDAHWIDPTAKARAESMNYTVVDASSVLATHLTEVCKTHAHELLSRQEVHELVANLKTKAPKLVEDSVPAVVKIADLHRVLQNLLRERIAIRDIETIVETLADWMPKTKDIDILSEYVRNALRRQICQMHAAVQPSIPGMPDAANSKPKITAITLDPALEDFINAYIDRSAAGTSLTMPASTASIVTTELQRGLNQLTAAGHAPIILASPQVRAIVRQLIETTNPAASVLGYNEIVPGIDLETVALVQLPPGLARSAA